MIRSYFVHSFCKIWKVVVTAQHKHNQAPKLPFPVALGRRRVLEWPYWAIPKAIKDWSEKGGKNQRRSERPTQQGWLTKKKKEKAFFMII